MNPVGRSLFLDAISNEQRSEYYVGRLSFIFTDFSKCVEVTCVQTFSRQRVVGVNGFMELPLHVHRSVFLFRIFWSGIRINLIVLLWMRRYLVSDIWCCTLGFVQMFLFTWYSIPRRLLKQCVKAMACVFIVDGYWHTINTHNQAENIRHDVVLCSSQSRNTSNEIRIRTTENCCVWLPHS